MAWRGVDDDQNLYWGVSFDGKWWSPQQRLNDRASTDAPALAVYRDKLYMAWRGAGDDNLWWASYDGNPDLKWSDQIPLTDKGSVEGPTLAVFQDKLFMAWRGVSGDQGLYWATYDGNPDLKWSDQQTPGDRGSFDVPALAVFQDNLFMAWRGIEGDENLWWATYDENDHRKWTDQHPLTDRGSTEGPALAAFQDKLYMVWKGVSGIDEDDERLFWATYDQSNPRKWTDQNIMERVSADQSGIVVLGSLHRPALAVFQNSTFVAGAGYNIVSSTGVADTGNSDSLQPGENPDPNGPPLPQGPDPSPDHPPPAPPPKGIFYTIFGGNPPTLPIITLPIIVFTDRASERTVAQAVYFDIPLSLRNLMSKHGFDPARGLKEFIKDTAPALSDMSPLPLRALVGF
jgi:hypothetical protein